jgi:nucleolar protein 56
MLCSGKRPPVIGSGDAAAKPAILYIVDFPRYVPMPPYWFEWLADKGGDLSGIDLKEWVVWLDSHICTKEDIVPLDWQMAVDCGLFTTRRQYLFTLHTLCMVLGEHRLASALQEGDERILSMVHTLDELNGMVNRLTERLVDWYATIDPTFTRKDPVMREGALLARMKEGKDAVFLSCVEEGQHLLSLRNSLSQEVSRQAESHYPNCSALLGGLVAARLVAQAGGLSRLARMPSATIQVLGAESALFSHLHTGTPPPKHGIIYQHRRVHAAPRDLRGRVARVLASRVALAARLDYYRKSLNIDFVQESQTRIDRAGKRS